MVRDNKTQQREGSYPEQAERFLERQYERIPPGALGPLAIYGSLAAGLATSVATKSKVPLETVIQGISGGAIGNSLNSLVGHRQGAHESVKTSPKTNKTLRAMTAMWGGAKPRAVAMHRVHHETSDTVSDPHAPSQKGRWGVFSRLIKITHEFEREHPELVAKLEESEYTKEKWYENLVVLSAGILATHAAIAKSRGRSMKSALVSSGIHVGLLYLQNTLYTADVHPEDEGGEIKNFDYDPLVNVVLGSEANHSDHHDDPGNPRHSDMDAVYAVALGMRELGLAYIPRLDE